MNWLYLWVDLLVLLIPLLGSFESRIRFYRHWRSLFSAILIVLVPFILWDIRFTETGVWHFNDQFSGRFSLLGLPLAEWLFFICIPYACMYIYEWVGYVLGPLSKSFKKHSGLFLLHSGLAIVCLFLAFWNVEKAYTSAVMGLSGFLLISVNIFRPSYMFRFWISYLVTLVPFFIVNGYLTAKPIVIYNDAENLGIRLFTIPLEDLFYTFIMLLPIVMIYEKLNKRKVVNDKA